MKIETWREDDFEEPSFDTRFFTACGTTSSITEGEPYSLFLGETPDIDYGLTRKWIPVLGAAHPRKVNEPLWFWPRAHFRPSPNSLINRHQCLYALLDPSAIALSRSSIDELAWNFDPVENVTALSWYVNEPPKFETIHPLTSPIYDQLADVPIRTKEAIQVVLNQFAASLSHIAAKSMRPLRLAALEDSSYLLEWIFEDRRLGFSFETNPKESGWYFVFSAASSERFESGTMDQLEMSRLIKLMLKR